MRRFAHRRTADLWLVVAGLALIMLSTSATWSAAANRLDRGVFTGINSLPDTLYRPLWVVQLLGVLGMPIAAAVIALGMRKFRLAAGLALLVPAKLIVELYLLKSLVIRERPGASIPGAILRDVPAGGLSFPSGHAVVLFGVVALLSPYLRRRGCVVILVIAVVAVSARVYLGAHTPLDVIGGAAAGLTVGALLNLVVGVPHRAARVGRAST